MIQTYRIQQHLCERIPIIYIGEKEREICRIGISADFGDYSRLQPMAGKYGRKKKKAVGFEPTAFWE